MNLAETDPAAQRLVASFRAGLEQLGWKEGYRWSAGDRPRHVNRRGKFYYLLRLPYPIFPTASACIARRFRAS
jgi:hypothetical protein